MRHGWVLALLLGTAALGTTAEPRLELEGKGPGRQLVLSSLPEILKEVSIRENLDTGLTTSFAIRVQLPATQPAGYAWIDIRFEIWDSYYNVAWRTSARPTERKVLKSFEHLVRWWRELRLAVIDVKSTTRTRTATAKVYLDVIPFSAAEQRDMEEWFTETLRRKTRDPAEDAGHSGDQDAPPLSETFNALLSTSIQRRALDSYRWSCPLPAELRR